MPPIKTKFGNAETLDQESVSEYLSNLTHIDGQFINDTTAFLSFNRKVLPYVWNSKRYGLLWNPNSIAPEQLFTNATEWIVAGQPHRDDVALSDYESMGFVVPFNPNTGPGNTPKEPGSPSDEHQFLLKKNN